MKSTEEKIMEHVLELFGEEASKRATHHSYCSAPFEDCCCKHLGEIDCDTSLISSGFIDSFSMVAVLVFLENEFNIKISDKDGLPANFDTVNRMTELVRKYTS